MSQSSGGGIMGGMSGLHVPGTFAHTHIDAVAAVLAGAADEFEGVGGGALVGHTASASKCDATHDDESL